MVNQVVDHLTLSIASHSACPQARAFQVPFWVAPRSAGTVFSVNITTVHFPPKENKKKDPRTRPGTLVGLVKRSRGYQWINFWGNRN